MNYTTFNRHEIFTEEDMKAVRDAIDYLEVEYGSRYILLNELYGLYDGHLYDYLVEELWGKLKFKTFCNLHKTILKIERLTDES